MPLASSIADLKSPGTSSARRIIPLTQANVKVAIVGSLEVIKAASVSESNGLGGGEGGG